MKKLGFAIFFATIVIGMVFAGFFGIGKSVFRSPISLSFGSKVTGSGDIAKEERQLEEFDSLDIGGALDIQILEGERFRSEIEADENLLELIELDVDDRTLTIRTTERYSTKNPVRIKIYAPSIARIKASGASTVSLENPNQESFELRSSGAAKISISGKTESFSLKLSGACSIDAENLIAQSVRVYASGASNATINASEELDVNLSGASSVKYKGDPAEIDKRIRGASSMKRMD